MPSKPVQSYSNIFEVLKDFSIFDDEGKLKKESHNVWNEAIVNLPKMNRHNLYIYVQQNRHRIQTNLKRNSGKVESITQNKNSITEQAIEREEPFKILNELHSLKYSVSFNAVITNICSRPFYVMYSLPEQLDLWNYVNKHQTSKVFLIVLNNLVQNVTTRQKSSSNVLLYALATEVEKKQF